MLRRSVRPHAVHPGRGYRRLGIGVLSLVAATGAVLSWESLYSAAAENLGGHSPLVILAGHQVNAVGAVFSLLLDGLILAASLLYVAGVKAQRPVAGWRAAAHAGIAGTVLANLAAADTLGAAPWHVAAPAVWSLIVELCARDILGELRAVRSVQADRISWKLWISSPAEQARTTWRMLRTLEASAQVARVEADRCAAASVALSRALPGRANRRTRRQITRRMWAGTITPESVFDSIGWIGSADRVEVLDPEVILRRALRAVLPIESIGSSRIEAGSDRIECPIELPIGSDRPPIDPRSDRVGSDRPDRIDPPAIGSGPAIESTPLPIESAGSVAAASTAPARDADVVALRAAIESGDLPATPSVEAVRTFLKIGPRYARAAVRAVVTEG